MIYSLQVLKMYIGHVTVFIVEPQWSVLLDSFATRRNISFPINTFLIEVISSIKVKQ